MSESRTTGDAGQDQTTELPAAGQTAAMPGGAQAAAQQPASPPQPAGPVPVPGFPLAAEPPEHPQATTILILGVLGLGGLWLTSPIAWYMGTKALAEIDAAPERYSKREFVNIGRILGMAGTILLIVGLVVTAVYLLFVFTVLGASAASY